MTVNNNPNDNVRRSQTNCMRCNKGQDLNTVPFRGRYITLCSRCLRYVQR